MPGDGGSLVARLTSLRYGPGMAGKADHVKQERETHFGFRSVSWSEKPALVRGVFNSVARRYDLMNDVMSGGLHRLWKSAFVDMLNPQVEDHILDVAGGTGDIAFRIADRVAARAQGRYPDIAVFDINEEMIRAGLARPEADRFRALKWGVGDAERLPFADHRFDAYTIAFGIRNVRDLKTALGEAYRVLRPGGRFLCLEFSRVAVPLLDVLYDRYSFDVLPLMGQWIAGDRDSYQYLAESIRRFPHQTAFARHIEAAGFSRVSYRNLSGGIVAIHSAWRI